MVNICWYFQVHQPFRIRPYRIFDIGESEDYFDDKLNDEILRKVSYKCYLPMNYLLLKLLKKHPELKFSFSISGVAIEQMEKYFPEVLESFKDLVATGRVELLSETYYHSLSGLYSKDEFYDQISQHKKLIKHHFNVEPKVFRNTELIYYNEVAEHVADLGFEAMLLEGWGPILDWRSPNYVYTNLSKRLKLLTKNYKLSDDIAFRFSNQAWEEYPMDTHKFANWVNESALKGEVINLFMDYETFGEHQWEESGIFDFMEHLPQVLMQNEHVKFVTPSEAAKLEVRDVLDVHDPLSWADSERDISAWIGNKMQEEALHDLYSIEKDVKKYGTLKELDIFKKLTTSDHFYYMCTKYFQDGDVHKYFSCYESPYDAYLYFKNVVRSFKKNIMKRKEEALSEKNNNRNENKKINSKISSELSKSKLKDNSSIIKN